MLRGGESIRATSKVIRKGRTAIHLIGQITNAEGKDALELPEHGIGGQTNEDVMRKLTAVIIAYNEARNIKRCIASLLNVADEIVVVDSYSTDATPSICKGLGVQFHQRDWKGYSKQKNYGNGLASNDWILSIDADEALSEKLKKSILHEKENGKSYNYSFNRLTNYCGKWIHYCGWYPDTKIRMFNEQNLIGMVRSMKSYPLKRVLYPNLMEICCTTVMIQ